MSIVFNRILCFKQLSLINSQRLQSRWIETKSIKTILDSNTKDDLIRVIGWVKSYQNKKSIKFVHLNDGSDCRQLQLVITKETAKDEMDQIETLFKDIHFNAAVEVTGKVLKSSHKQQNVELHVNKIKLISNSDENETIDYPFEMRHNYSLEQVRKKLHLRGHDLVFASVLRFRSRFLFEIHKFFQNEEVCQINTPILTSNNCEGGCETFQADQTQFLSTATQKSDEINDVKKRGFFLKPVYLTASAQLHLEALTTGIGNVYTLSPTFRAERSLTRHHLAEFYMLEVELIDMNELNDLLNFVEKFIKTVCSNIINNSNQFDINLIVESSNKNGKYYLIIIN
jgi:asparaginyl-tRNA synthetase